MNTLKESHFSRAPTLMGLNCTYKSNKTGSASMSYFANGRGAARAIASGGLYILMKLKQSSSRGFCIRLTNDLRSL